MKLTLVAIVLDSARGSEFLWERPSCLNFWVLSEPADGAIAVRECFSIPEPLRSMAAPGNYETDFADLAENVSWPPISVVTPTHFLLAASQLQLKPPFGNTVAGRDGIGVYIPPSWDKQDTMARSHCDDLETYLR